MIKTYIVNLVISTAHKKSMQEFLGVYSFSERELVETVTGRMSSLTECDLVFDKRVKGLLSFF